jgi:hypothetical protein
MILILVRVSAVSADEDASRKDRVKSHTVRLKEDLLCAYDKSVRPVYQRTVTVVFVSMFLRSLTFVSNGAAQVFINGTTFLL